ncbi:unnamed protein product, partial [Nesidiocoris tenuis]
MTAHKESYEFDRVGRSACLRTWRTARRIIWKNRVTRIGKFRNSAHFMRILVIAFLCQWQITRTFTTSR